MRMPVRLIRLAHVFIYFSPDSDLLGVLLIREMPGATVGSLRAVIYGGFHQHDINNTKTTKTQRSTKDVAPIKM